jgi:hypothetical protein
MKTPQTVNLVSTIAWEKNQNFAKKTGVHYATREPNWNPASIAGERINKNKCLMKKEIAAVKISRKIRRGREVGR